MFTNSFTSPPLPRPKMHKHTHKNCLDAHFWAFFPRYVLVSASCDLTPKKRLTFRDRAQLCLYDVRPLSFVCGIIVVAAMERKRKREDGIKVEDAPMLPPPSCGILLEEEEEEGGVRRGPYKAGRGRRRRRSRKAKLPKGERERMRPRKSMCCIEWPCSPYLLCAMYDYTKQPAQPNPALPNKPHRQFEGRLIKPTVVGTLYHSRQC